MSQNCHRPIPFNCPRGTVVLSTLHSPPFSISHQSPEYLVLTTYLLTYLLYLTEPRILHRPPPYPTPRVKSPDPTSNPLELTRTMPNFRPFPMGGCGVDAGGWPFLLRLSHGPTKENKCRRIKRLRCHRTGSCGVCQDESRFSVQHLISSLLSNTYYSHRIHSETPYIPHSAHSKTFTPVNINAKYSFHDPFGD